MRSLDRYKFHPLFNHNGSTSRFRVTCLTIFAFSLILHVVLKDDGEQAVPSSASGELTAATASQAPAPAAAPASAEAVTAQAAPAPAAAPAEPAAEEKSSGGIFSWFKSKPAEPEGPDLLTMRKEALTELSSSARFMATCGTMNEGYVGCKYPFSQNVLTYYDADIDAADDGYLITLTAKGAQAADACSRLQVSSDGVYEAYDKTGALSSSCLVDLRPDEKLTINRSVDNIIGSPAPSGMHMIAPVDPLNGPRSQLARQ